MKKKLFLSVVAISVIIALMLSFAACTKPLALEQGDFTTVINRQLPDLKINEDGNFDVLMLTDTHFLGYGKNDTKTLNAIDKVISSNEYQLVVITGDMLEGYNNKSKYNKTNAIENVASMFEKNELYWAVVAGNNDGEYCGDKKAIFSKLAKYEHCLVSDSDVGGVGNYFINIVNDVNIKLHTLIFMDSGMRGKNKQLIPIENGQIDWYKTIAQNCKIDNIQNVCYNIRVIRVVNKSHKGGEHMATLEIEKDSLIEVLTLLLNKMDIDNITIKLKQKKETSTKEPNPTDSK